MMQRPIPLIANHKDPEVFIALKRLCSYVVDEAWQTSSSSPGYEYAIAKSKEYEHDVKMLAEIDLDVAWGQVKHETMRGTRTSSKDDFNPWYRGELPLSNLLDSFEPLAEMIDFSTPRYLLETEFLHYYSYLRSKLPSSAPTPTVIPPSSSLN